MVMAINPDWVDADKLNIEHPPFPETKTKSAALHSAFFFCNPGSVYQITKSGTWGDATGATAEKGEEFMSWGVRSVIDLLDYLEKTFSELPVREPKR